MTTTYRCPRCPYTYTAPVAVKSVTHRCKPHDRKATRLTEEPTDDGAVT